MSDFDSDELEQTYDNSDDKLHLLVRIHEMECQHNIRMSKRFSTADSTEAIRFEYQRMQREAREYEIRQRREREDAIKARYLAGMACMVGIGIGIVSAATVNKEGKEQSSKTVKCLKCGVENCVPLDNKPIYGYEDSCLICLEKANVYQPQCGHVCLCKDCFDELK
jgi:hypothetical protein